MRRVIAAVIAGVVLGPVSAFASSLELRVGGFYPQAEATLFRDNEDLFDTRKEDWQGAVAGLEYAWNVGRNAEIGIHIDGFGRSLGTSYRTRVRPGGGEIRQTHDLDIVPVGMTFRHVFGGRHARLRPYVGIGA